MAQSHGSRDLNQANSRREAGLIARWGLLSSADTNLGAVPDPLPLTHSHAKHVGRWPNATLFVYTALLPAGSRRRTPLPCDSPAGRNKWIVGCRSHVIGRKSTHRSRAYEGHRLRQLEYEAATNSRCTVSGQPKLSDSYYRSTQAPFPSLPY